MIETNDWSQLTDANGQLFDPRMALTDIESGNPAAGYDELWERVHHQGDLGTATYAVVPALVDLMIERTELHWRAYALVATIEECRRSGGTPPIPEWLHNDYRTAIRKVVRPALAQLALAKTDEDVRSLIAVVAYAKGQRSLGAIALWTEDERREALREL